MLLGEELNRARSGLLSTPCRAIWLREDQRYLMAGEVQRRKRSLGELWSAGEDESQEAVRPICEVAWRSAPECAAA
jgi:hypothetical protein